MVKILKIIQNRQQKNLPMSNAAFSVGTAKRVESVFLIKNNNPNTLLIRFAAICKNIFIYHIQSSVFLKWLPMYITKDVKNWHSVKIKCSACT